MGDLCVETLAEGVHSGDASGIVPDTFRIARHLLDRLEDSATGRYASANACMHSYIYLHILTYIHIHIYICSCMSVSFQFLRCHHPPTNATACSGYFLRRCKWRCRPHACRRSLPHRVSWVTRRVQSPLSVLAWEHATLC